MRTFVLVDLLGLGACATVPPVEPRMSLAEIRESWIGYVPAGPRPQADVSCVAPFR